MEPTAIKESRNIVRVIISKLASLDPLNVTEKESLKQYEDLSLVEFMCRVFIYTHTPVRVTVGDSGICCA